jgi:hypothetical protein
VNPPHGHHHSQLSEWDLEEAVIWLLCIYWSSAAARVPLCVRQQTSRLSLSLPRLLRLLPRLLNR